MEITLGMGASQNDAMVRAAQKLLKLHQSGEVVIGDLLPEIQALSNGDTGFVTTVLDAEVVFTYNNKDYAIRWLVDEFAVVGNIATKKPPVKEQKVFQLAKIETCGIEHIDYPNAIHTALKKLIEMHDAGEVEIDCEEEVRAFTRIKPRITVDGGEKCYSARFMEAFEEISELGLEQFFKVGKIYYDIQISNNNSEVTAVPH